MAAIFLVPILKSNRKVRVPCYSAPSFRLVPLALRKRADKIRWKKNNNNREKETEEKQYVTRHCRSGDIIITRFVIASNNGWHPRPPIARIKAAILKFPKSKSVSTHGNHHF